MLYVSPAPTLYRPSTTPCSAPTTHTPDRRPLSPTSGPLFSPRQHLFASIAREERIDEGATQFSCTGAYLEIYNDAITDLLEPPPPLAPRSADANASWPPAHVPSLKLREDAARGIYVENLTRENLRSSDDALRLLATGAAQRQARARTSDTCGRCSDPRAAPSPSARGQRPS